MAEAALLVVAAEGVLKKVGSLLAEEMIHLGGFKQQLNALRVSLTMIRAVLHDAEARQVREEAVKLWLKNLKDVAYAAKDALGEFDYEILRHKGEIKSQLTRKVCCWFSSSNPILFRVKMAHKINNINASLEKINKEAIALGLQWGGVGVDVVPHQVTFTRESDNSASPRKITTLSRESDSFLVNSRIYGRKDDLSKILEMLIGSDGNKEEVLSVIPIVGIGGLGKTTLAMLIYNHESVIRYFDIRIWIRVSTNFDTKRLLLEILEYLGGTKREVQSRDVVLRDLEKVLGGKKYLLVLDDVWNEDAVEWDEFKSCLLAVSTNKGNNIVVTTRNQGVASIMGTCPTHCLGGLSEDECLRIFKINAFRSGWV